MTIKSWLAGPNSSRHYLREDAISAGRAVSAGAKVLDAGAGDCRYREHFAHTRYESADFAQVDKPYAPDLDYVCSLDALPMPNETYDLVFCSQVLEHLPEPVRALQEMHRVLKPGGIAWLSAPLFYAEHEQPYDFHRYTQFAWRRMAEQVGFEIDRIEWLEGYYGTLSYQLGMAARQLGPAWLPLRAAFVLLANLFGRLDIRRKVTDRGMPKNYRCVMRKSASSNVARI